MKTSCERFFFPVHDWESWEPFTTRVVSTVGGYPISGTEREAYWEKRRCKACGKSERREIES